MGERDQTTGPLKEAVSDLANDGSLKSEEKLDQVVGKGKEKMVRVKGKLEQAVDQIKEALRGRRSRRLA